MERKCHLLALTDDILCFLLLPCARVVIVGDTFVAKTAGGILLYEGEDITAVFKSWGTPQNSIFRAEAGSMGLIMLMKPAKAVDDFGNKRAVGSDEDAHRP